MQDGNYRWVVVAAGGVIGCMATGPLLGGSIYDTYANYGWLYVASFGIGLGAFLIASSFLPFPQHQPAAASFLPQG